MIIFFVALLTCGAVTFGEITQAEIDKALQGRQRDHPYLYFSATDKAAIFDRLHSDEFSREIYERQLVEARRLLFAPVDPVAPPREIRRARYEGNYHNAAYIDTYAGNAFILAFAYQMTGDPSYAIKSYEFADAVCDQPTWIHPAHEFPQIYDRVWPMGAKDDQVVFSYAQHTDHMLFQIAAVYDWLYPALDKRQRDRIRSAILEKAILRVRGNYEYHWWATAYRCNWCSVCHSSLGVAAMALLTEDPVLTDVIATSFNGIWKNLEEIKDGGWCEGMDYLDYTLSTAEHFAFVLKRLTGGKCNLYKHPRFSDGIKTLLYGQFPGNQSVHFGDSGSARCGSYTLYNRLILETGNTAAAWLQENKGFANPATLYDLFSSKATVKPVLPENSSIYFPATGWVIMRSDFTDSNKVSVAAKCDKHNDPHHGHLDSGHFSLYWRGEEWLCDHGSAGYDRKYFDEDRWTYPLVLNTGHNTVLVNGEKQIPGKHKNKPWNYNVGGKIAEFRTGKSHDYAILDASDAFAKIYLKKWRRHLILEKPDVTIVVDELRCSKNDEIEVRYHSTAAQQILDNLVLLKNDKGILAIIPMVQGKSTIRSGKHAILPAIQNSTLTQVPYFGIITPAQENENVIGTLIVPVAGFREAQELANSVVFSLDSPGVLTVAFMKGGTKHEYLFTAGKDGIVLK